MYLDVLEEEPSVLGDFMVSQLDSLKLRKLDGPCCFLHKQQLWRGHHSTLHTSKTKGINKIMRCIEIDLDAFIQNMTRVIKLFSLFSL